MLRLSMGVDLEAMVEPEEEEAEEKEDEEDKDGEEVDAEGDKEDEKAEEESATPEETATEGDTKTDEKEDEVEVSSRCSSFLRSFIGNGRSRRLALTLLFFGRRPPSVLSSGQSIVPLLLSLSFLISYARPRTSRISIHHELFGGVWCLHALFEP